MREDLLIQLYGILRVLQDKIINNGFHFLVDPVPDEFVQSGIYFFFDQNIESIGGGNKIIRIGKTGDNNNNRLQLHRSGNEQVSVFRRHVRNALENNNQPFDPNSVSHYIHPLPYLYLPIAEHNHLGTLEQRVTEIVSNRYQPMPFDSPPEHWLGYHAVHPAISESHLWNVHYVGNYQNDNEGIYHGALALLNEHVENLE